MGGIELLDAIGTAAPNALTVIMTGFGTVETAIDAMKRGAYDYILKPFKVEEVIHVVQRGLEKQRLAAENLRLREALSLYKVSEAIAASLSLEEVLATIGDTAHPRAQGRPRVHVARRRRGRLLRAPAPRAAAQRSLRRRRASELPLGERTTRRRASRASARVRRLAPQAFIEHYAAHSTLLEQGGKGARFFATPPATPLASLVSVPLRMKTRLLGWIARRELHEAEALRRGPAQAALDRRLARRRRDRERAPLRGSAGHLPADDPGPRARHRQDGPLHRRPLRARRDVRDVPRACASGCRPRSSRSCARAR